MVRTQKQDREWILKMAEAESKTLAFVGGILVGSLNFTVSVPTDVVDKVKAKRTNVCYNSFVVA